jgi:ABC-type lipoprotein export system ATPase subunit/predicted  nucleic acid-binding Zn-ribbon protein
MALNIGSEWHRWDVHIHTPGTVLNNKYGNCTLDQFIQNINEKTDDVIALGITDYYSIENYACLKEKFDKGAFKNIKLLFPNIEMRLAIPTEKSSAINIHLIISPDDPRHIIEIQQHLNRLSIKYNGRPISCNKSEIIKFGNEINQKLPSDEQRYMLGIENFKIDFTTFVEWYDDSDWLKNNSLIALSAKQSDGTSALSYNGGFAAKRHEIEKKADIIFSAAPSDIKHWLGDGTMSEQELIKKFNGIKPCLVGSDAHSIDKIFSSEFKKYCWIKAEPTFEGFRQILYEPKERVYIGEIPPNRTRKSYLSQICVPEVEWFPNSNIPINKGLVSIIGPRGSGKTALLDIISIGFGAYEENDASFISKAKNLALPLTVNIEVNKSRQKTINFNMDYNESINARYLSQHFVEQLCSTEGASQKLINEIENFIFEKLEDYKKKEANNFSELKETIILSYDNNIFRLSDEIKECNNEITRINELYGTIESRNKKINDLNKEIQLIKLPKINKDEELVIASKQKEYEEKFQAINDKVKDLKRKIDILKNTISKIENYNQDLLEKGQDLINELSEFNITKEEKKLFAVSFSQSLIELLNKKRNEIQVIFKKLLGFETNPEEKTYYWYKNELEKIKIDLNKLSNNERKYIELNNQIQEKNQRIKVIENKIDEIKKLNTEIYQEKRLIKYKKIFKLIQEKCNALSELYAPLENSLKTSCEENIPLSFYVKIGIDLKSWVDKGNKIIDSRFNTKINDEGGLKVVARKILFDSWKSGDPDKIAESMKVFIQKYIVKDIKSDLLREHCTFNDLAQWLFSTEHISTPYEIKYEGVSIEKLSPGTRGIVLMVLFLKVDRNDTRPLLIDQPEDNLDPASVYNKLVPYFKEAKNRRQIIMVTHNPNLVVGTDSDQIIVANSLRRNEEQLPQFNYISGGLEDPEIIKNVCDILEGGEIAFMKRKERYKAFPVTLE